MKLDRFIRLSLGFLILLAFVIAIAALLFVTEAALNVWDRLAAGPPLVLYGYVTIMGALVVAAVWLVWRLVVRRKPVDRTKRKPVRLSREEIEKRLRDADAAGVDTSAALAELHELALRQRERSVHLCFFGEISTGKSSLIRALVATES